MFCFVWKGTPNPLCSALHISRWFFSFSRITREQIRFKTIRLNSRLIRFYQIKRFSTFCKTRTFANFAKIIHQTALYVCRWFLDAWWNIWWRRKVYLNFQAELFSVFDSLIIISCLLYKKIALLRCCCWPFSLILSLRRQLNQHKLKSIDKPLSAEHNCTVEVIAGLKIHIREH